MTATIGVREIARNINLLQEYDYIDIEDKKTKEYKGLLISAQYADEIKAFLENKLQIERQKELDEIMQFAGIASGDSENMTAQEIKEKKADRYNYE
ncbi:MAG: hypothetical protein U9O64_00815 [Campylobacterota bacterium]|nr:hypothetical protein [Campylobacterota bacterium]